MQKDTQIDFFSYKKRPRNSSIDGKYKLNN